MVFCRYTRSVPASPISTGPMSRSTLPSHDTTANVSGKRQHLKVVDPLPEDGIERNRERRHYLARGKNQFRSRRQGAWGFMKGLPSRLFWSKSIRPLLCPKILAILLWSPSVGLVQHCGNVLGRCFECRPNLRYLMLSLLSHHEHPDQQ